jgi:type VI secretion system secreted protein VgrG
MANYTQKGRPFRVYTTLGTDVLLLENLEGEEAVSRPFEYRLDMVSTNEAISADSLINKAVHVEIDLADGSKRYVHGLVTHFISRGKQQVLTAYSMVIRPWFWFLSLWQDCKIFQNKSVPDIVEEVFKGCSYTDFSLKLYATYQPREYCVQYRESSMDFVSRLLEEEGIFYYFEHTADKDTLVLTDKVVGCTPCPGNNLGPLAPFGSSMQEPDVVLGIEQELQTATAKVTLQDYNFTTPNSNLQATATGTGSPEFYDYPGKYDTRGDGSTYADIRMAELETPMKIVRGNGTCRAFTSGYKFDLKNHMHKDMNTTYLLTRVHVSMATNSYRTDAEPRDDYSNSFEAVPASVVYRPARMTRKPVISGVQTAIVVGTSGEEIYSDKYCRVKVQFYWDRLGKKDQNSSCWVRVSQDWAGKTWGAVFVPRIGQEVVVSFLEGDPDRPLITGRVYNADQMPPYTLPDNQTQSGVKSRSSKAGGTANYNEFFFEDKKGSELIRMHAEKDLLTEVENDETRKVMHDRTVDISNNETQTVDKGNETLTLNMGNQALTIKQGNQTVDIKMGNQTTTLDMGNQSTTLKMGNQTTKVNLGSISEEAMQQIELKVGQSSIVINQMGVTIKGMMISIEGQIQVQVKGVLVQVNADALLILKGGITMIN